MVNIKKWTEIDLVLSKENCLAQASQALDNAAILATDNKDFAQLMEVGQGFASLSEFLGNKKHEDEGVLMESQSQIGFSAGGVDNE